MTDGQWQIETGYVPGLIGRVVTLHADYYAREAGFGAAFEATVAAGMADFAPRLSRPENQCWRAMAAGAIHGHVAIDGQDLGARIGHLRWFILSDEMRGRGAGKALIAAALDHCDAQGFAETRLWTFAGLDAARSLYERHGFRLAEERDGDQWGKVVREQMFVRPLGG